MHMSPSNVGGKPCQTSKSGMQCNTLTHVNTGAEFPKTMLWRMPSDFDNLILFGHTFVAFLFHTQYATRQAAESFSTAFEQLHQLVINSQTHHAPFRFMGPAGVPEERARFSPSHPLHGQAEVSL